MTDARLRELERQWKETGTAEDEAAFLTHRLRSGDLARERLELLAALRYPAALLAVEAPASELYWFLYLVRDGKHVLIRAMAAVVEATAHLQPDPLDKTFLQDVAHSLRAWAECPCEEHQEIRIVGQRDGFLHAGENVAINRLLFLASNEVRTSRPVPLARDLPLARAQELQAELEAVGGLSWIETTDGGCTLWFHAYAGALWPVTKAIARVGGRTYFRARQLRDAPWCAGWYRELPHWMDQLMNKGVDVLGAVHSVVTP